MLNFKEDGCEELKGLLNGETTKFLHDYTFDQRVRKFKDDGSLETFLIPSGSPTHGLLNDPVMVMVALMIQPKLEEITGMRLFPTYNRSRTYTTGNSMVNHVDRASCEISVSILLDAQYKNDKDYRYELLANTESYKKGIKLTDDKLLPEDNGGISIRQTPGDGFLYRGQDIPHQRQIFDAEVGSYHTQLFCHFIDIDGAHYPEWKYDKARGLFHGFLEYN